MLLNVYTVFNRVDGSCDAPVVGRSHERIATEFANTLFKRNQELKAKNYPPINSDEYELRCVGTFEDTTGVISPSPVSVIPFNLPNYPSKDSL